MSKSELEDEKYARESFGMRRMASWQLWGITIVGAVVLAAIVIWAAG